MPLYGTLDVDGALPMAPHVTTIEAPHWELPDARFVQVNWEVSDRSLELTPPALHPSIPPYAAFLAGRYEVSPVGPFTLAQVRLVVRAGIRPRALCLGAVCDSAEAVAALRENWGYPVELGEVSFSTRHDRVKAVATLGGREVLEIAVVDPEAIGGADLMTFDNVHLVRLGEDEAGAVLQIDPEYAIHQADRGRPVVKLPDPEALGMRGRLELRSAITGFTFRADTDLVPVRFKIDPRVPAVQGTSRLAPAA
jgi:hypothetical protein